MTAMTHDTTLGATPVVVAPSQRLSTGLVLAVVSAITSGMSGALGRGLLDTGWSAGAITLVRVGIAALVLTPFALVALRGQWSVLRRNAGLVLAYGALAVAAAQFCYFSAVQHMQVGPALLIEYTSPAVVVVYLWLRFGERPGRLTIAGAALAAVGLLLVLDIFSGADLSSVGVLWAMAATVGSATYFIINSNDDTGLPSVVLAWGGLTVGTLLIGALALAGVLPLTGSTRTVTYAGHAVHWWLPVVVLGVVTAAISYVTGIAAGRHLGSRIASFVALSEVVLGVLWAWLLLAELPGLVQLVGGLLILGGVIAVKAGNPVVVTAEPVPA